MGWKDAWHDLTHDDGFFPLSTRGQARLLMDLVKAKEEGGQEGVNAFVLERYNERGHQAFDIPLVSWDDDVSVEDVSGAVDYAGDLFRDILTEVFALIGAALATVVNEVPTSIDDMARPPVELSDAAAIYFPYIRDNQGFGNTTMVDAPSVMIALPPSYAMMRDAQRLFNHDIGLVLLPNSNKQRDNIFRWSQSQSKTGVWV